MFKKIHKIPIYSSVIALVVSTMVQPLNATGIINDSGSITASTIQSPIAPLWQNITGNLLMIGFKNGTIFLNVTVTGPQGTTYSNGVVTLTKMTGSDMGIVKKWTGLSSNSCEFVFVDSSYKATKGTYRLSLTINATYNGFTETITLFNDEAYSG